MSRVRKDKLKGGVGDNISKQDIADKFKVSLQKIEKELKMGSDVELEHVKSRSLSKEIAMDHLVEIPDYYTRLKKMEKEGKKKWDIKESAKSNVKRLFREHVELDIMDETPDVSTYKIIYNNRPVGEISLANVLDMEFTQELVYVSIDPKEDHHVMKLMLEVILAIWEASRETQKILLTPMPESRTFWHKMGATRLNDSYLMLSRGH